MAVPTIVGGGSFSAVTTQSPSVATGTHQANDVLLALLMCNASKKPTLSGSWAWVQKDAADGGGDLFVQDANFSAGLAWLRATGAGMTLTPNWGSAGSTSVGHYGKVHIVRGCRTSGLPYDSAKVAGAPTNTNRPTHGGITAVTADTLYAAWAAVDDDNWWSAAVKTGFTEVDQESSTTGGDAMYYLITQALASVGAAVAAATDFVNSPGTMNAADYWLSFSLALASLAPAAAAKEGWGVLA